MKNTFYILIAITVSLSIIYQSKIVENKNQTPSEKKTILKNNFAIISNTQENLSAESKIIKHISLAPLGYESIYGPLPRSLTDTEIDSNFQVDEDGELIINEDIKYIFDYFLTTVGEESLEVIVARIREYINFKLEDPAKNSADRILTSYLNYQEALENSIDTIHDSSSNTIQSHDLDLIKFRLSRLKDIRRQYLDPDVVSAFFSEDEAYDEYTIEKLIISRNDQLNKQQKESMIQQLEAQLPETFITAKTNSQKPIELAKQTKELRSMGANYIRIRQLRETMYNSEVADRLEKLDKSRQLWNTKINDYKKSKSLIIKNNAMNSAEKQLRIDNLKEDIFSPSELKRITILENTNSF